MILQVDSSQDCVDEVEFLKFPTCLAKTTEVWSYWIPSRSQMEFSGASRLQSCKISDFSKDQHNPKLKKRMSLKDIG